MESLESVVPTHLLRGGCAPTGSLKRSPPLVADAPASASASSAIRISSSSLVTAVQNLRGLKGAGARLIYISIAEGSSRISSPILLALSTKSRTSVASARALLTHPARTTFNKGVRLFLLVIRASRPAKSA